MLQARLLHPQGGEKVVKIPQEAEKYSEEPEPSGPVVPLLCVYPEEAESTKPDKMIKEEE